MKISWMCSTLGIVRSRSRSGHDFEFFLHLPQYKLSSPISQLWHMVAGLIKYGCLSDTIKFMNIVTLELSYELLEMFHC